MYRLEKLYVDLIAEDRTVCIGYWTLSELFGKPLLQGMVESFWPDGRHEVVRARPASMPPPPLLSSSMRPAPSLRAPLPTREAPLRLRLPEGEMTWEFDAKHGSVSPTRIGRSLDWSVEFARARVIVSWPGLSGRPTLRGVGYADRVRLARLPRRLGLSSLRWGRVHLPDETLVFTSVRFRSGDGWSEAISWSSGSRKLSLPRFEIRDLHESALLELPGRSLTLRSVRVLHDGPAIDAGRFPHVFERLSVRTLAGPTRETRWLARAERPDRRPGGEGWAIHERVLFGSRSRDSDRLFSRGPDQSLSRRCARSLDRTVPE
jgi:hypothetical protein